MLKDDFMIGSLRLLCPPVSGSQLRGAKQRSNLISQVRFPASIYHMVYRIYVNRSIFSIKPLYF